MKILQLCYKPPVPPVDGGTLAMYSVAQGLLAAGHSLKILSLCSDKHPLLTDRIEPLFLQQTALETSFVDLSVHPLDAAVALLCGESYNVRRFDNPQFHKLIERTLADSDFDIIHVESIFLTPYLTTIRKHSAAPVILRAHNVEHRIWQQLASECRNPFKRWYLKKLALALRIYELEHINDFNGIVCITEDDAQAFRNEHCRRPITAIPFGIDVKPLHDAKADPFALFHIAAMDWQPNIDAVSWFLDSIWPLAKKEIPQLKLYLAGRKMPDSLKKLSSDSVNIVGEVPDAARFMADKQINIVPLKSASGLRIKIIEAMAHGKTVIATTTAAKGIDYTDGNNILIADTPAQFIKQIKLCTDNPQFAHQIGLNAHQFAQNHYSIDAVTSKLTDFYNIITKKTL